jgi:hypothetical protein
MALAVRLLVGPFGSRSLGRGFDSRRLRSSVSRPLEGSPSAVASQGDACDRRPRAWRGELGTEIFSKDWGSGRPIVFSHGWPLSADDWDTQMLFFFTAGLPRHRP